MSDSITLDRGFAAPRLSDQLAGRGLSSRVLLHLEADNDAINRLRVRGLLTEAEAEAATARLLASIRREIEAARSLGSAG